MTGVKAIAEALNVNTSMNSLDISNNYLTGNPFVENYKPDMTGVKAIADALSVSTSMNSLK